MRNVTVNLEDLFLITVNLDGKKYHLFAPTEREGRNFLADLGTCLNRYAVPFSEDVPVQTEVKINGPAY